jgi:hypothetical protein
MFQRPTKRGWIIVAIWVAAVIGIPLILHYCFNFPF